MKHQVDELEGALLDATVAKALGLAFELDHHEYDSGCIERWVIVTTLPNGNAGKRHADRRFFKPSEDWAEAGPIIEREHIDIASDGESGEFAWQARANCDFSQMIVDRRLGFGSTPLIAAMRAYVASKFGEEVDLP